MKNIGGYIGSILSAYTATLWVGDMQNFQLLEKALVIIMLFCFVSFFAVLGMVVQSIFNYLIETKHQKKWAISKTKRLKPHG